MSYTAAQVGDAAVPEAHTATATPAVVDVRGDDMPREAGTLPVRRPFRLGATPSAVAGFRDSFPDTAGSSTAGTTPGAHRVMNPEPARALGDSPESYPLPTDGLHPIAGELIANTRAVVELSPESAPDRPRAGSTGADPTRPARRASWWFLRPFDQLAAQRLAPFGLDKLEQDRPTASRPLRYDEPVAGAVPAPGGGDVAPGMQPIGSQPNSVRLLPEPWDTYAVNAGGPAYDAGVADPGRAAVASRGRSFRA